MASGFDARCEAGGSTGADGWDELTDSYKQTQRRYVESHGMPRVESKKRWQGAPPRTATLEGGHSDLRAVCCGDETHDIDCENGDYSLICSLATQTGHEDLVPTVFDYVANRKTYLAEICELLRGRGEAAAQCRGQQRHVRDMATQQRAARPERRAEGLRRQEVQGRPSIASETSWTVCRAL